MCRKKPPQQQVSSVRDLLGKRIYLCHKMLSTQRDREFAMLGMPSLEQSCSCIETIQLFCNVGHQLM
jgi:hypothetical protein